MSAPAESSPGGTAPRPPLVPRAVWVLGFVSMLMDISSEMIHALLPIYLVTVLGASTLAVGFIEGIAEATAMIVKVFSGALSDWLGRRKLLAALGYGLAAITKPVFPLATGLGWIVAARFVDRIGKGIRGAPRDALIADITTADQRGASFGLRQTLDTIGAFLGPLMAIGLMALSGDNFRLVFWIAVIPAFLSAALMLTGVDEPRRAAPPEKSAPPLRFAEMLLFPVRFWWVVGIASVLTLARFSDAFLILRAQNIGLPAMFVPLILVVMNVVYAAVAYPVGAMSDRIGRRGLLIAGTVLLIVANAVLAYGDGLVGLMCGVVLWGLHMGFTQSLFSALVADTVAAHLRGTAFGIFSVASGIALFAASVIAGALWDRIGPAATFLAGAAFAALALPGLMTLTPRRAG